MNKKVVLKNSNCEPKINPFIMHNSALSNALESMSEYQKNIKIAMQPTLDLQNRISAIIPDFSGLSKAVEAINIAMPTIYGLGESLHSIETEETKPFISSGIQKIDNLKELATSYEESEYYHSKISNDNILNLSNEMQIDIINECFINPSNGLTLNFKILPNDQKLLINTLIKGITKGGCSIEDFGDEINKQWLIECANRKSNDKVKRNVDIFIADRMKNMRSMVYRNLKVDKKINFLKSQNKVWNLLIS